MSDGGMTGSDAGAKRKRGFGALKERYETESAAQKSRIEELEAQMARSLPTVSAAADKDAQPRAGKGMRGDCLSFITDDTPYICLASTYSTITLRPGRARMNPEMTRVALSYDSSGAWSNCPFLIGDPASEENDQRIRLSKGKWWFHTLSRETAAMAWDDTRFRMPERTVVDPALFKGWDSAARTPRGTLVEITDFVPLRETLRIVLMRLRETFMDYGRRPDGLDFDPRIVNPYRNRIAGLSLGAVRRGMPTEEDLR